MTSPVLSCIKCLEEKPIDDFYRKRKGEELRETMCKSCVKRKSKARHNRLYESDPAYKQAYLQQSSDKAKTARRSSDPSTRARFIIQDSKKIDSRKGRGFSLDRDFVTKLISNPCHYCGEENCMMTLDRIDNDIGHIETNVVQACSRCNDTRGRMPHAAWVVVAKGMREARERGLFDGWLGDFNQAK